MKPTRHFDGAPVYSRPAIGSVCDWRCSCGCAYSAKVVGFFVDPTGECDVAMGEPCPDCGSSPGMQVEPATTEGRAA